MGILDTLLENKDEEYASFIHSLTPTISKDKFLGVRLPKLREIAKEFKNSDESKKFLVSLPHSYYDEDLLHVILLNYIKDYDTCILSIEKFLPYINSWASCDTLGPKVLNKNKTDLLKRIKIWIKSDKTYTIRFAVGCLQRYFLDEDFNTEHLDLVSKIRSDEYYVNMMISWYIATALAKQYDDTIKVLLDHKLDKWTHNKAIQKAIESNRISDSTKEYLRGLKY